MKVDSNEQLTSMLKHLAGDRPKITGVVIGHAKGELHFKIDDKIQMGVKVDARSGLKPGQVFELVMDDLHIEIDGKPGVLPAEAVPTSSSTRGCSPRDKADLQSICS